VIGTIVARGLIVLVVFPVIGHAIYTTVTWFLTRAVLPSLAVAEGWSSVFDRGVLGVTVLVAVLGAGSVCRRVWPTAPPPRATK
jgi:hypothetical protein